MNENVVMNFSCGIKEKELSMLKPKLLLVREGANETLGRILIKGRESKNLLDMEMYIKSKLKRLSLRKRVAPKGEFFNARWNVGNDENVEPISLKLTGKKRKKLSFDARK